MKSCKSFVGVWTNVRRPYRGEHSPERCNWHALLRAAFGKNAFGCVCV